RLFMSYSDDGGTTWTSGTVFTDPGCAQGTVAVGTSFPNACQDLSELFNALAVDDAGNVYVAFAWRDPAQANPEYDIYMEKGTPQSSGAVSFGQPVRVNTDGGTHYMPWLAAGQNGAVDVVFYDTPYAQGVGALNKPAAAPGSAVWDVYMAQSLTALGEGVPAVEGLCRLGCLHGTVPRRRAHLHPEPCLGPSCVFRRYLLDRDLLRARAAAVQLGPGSNPV